MAGPDIFGAISMAFAMARGDEDWAERTELSADSVFASFWALPLAIPAHLIAVEGERRLAIETDYPVPDVSQVVYATTQTISMAMAWIAGVGVLASIAARRGAGWKVTPLIMGFNWALFLHQLAQGLTLGLFMMAGQTAAALVAPLMVLVWAVWLYWGVIKRSLETHALATTGVIILLLIVSTAVRSLFYLVYQVTGLVPPLVMP